MQTIYLSVALLVGQVPTPAAIPESLQSNGFVADSPVNAADPTPTQPAEKKADGDEKKEDEKKEEKKEDEKFFLMKALECTSLGQYMAQNRLSISGWTEMSFTGSQARASNQPVVWNDRANEFLLQQQWLRLEKTLDLESKEWSWGWRIDTLFGTDYRFTLPRGLWNSQLLNLKGNQNLYGVDLIQTYVNAYLPNLFEGTEIRAGRMFCPWGYESNECVSTPLLSRSYAFNWSSPFTHVGIMVLPTFNKNWGAKLMLANGNDVYLDSAEELRFVGAVTWTSDDKKDSVTAGTVLGRGKFDASRPFNPATTGLQSEPTGRNNLNAFDLVFTHEFTDKLSYAVEGIFGYQYGVPAVPKGQVGTIQNDNGLTGTAHWGSIANYFTYKWNDKVSSIYRAEVFDDFQGQRTGFKGLYTANTLGIQCKPKSWLWFRPEIRYDYNGYSKPFDDGRRHGLLTAATDLIIRW